MTLSTHHKKPRPSGRLSPLDSNPRGLSAVSQSFLPLSLSPSLCALTFNMYYLSFLIEYKLYEGGGFCLFCSAVSPGT